ncbi:valine--pyruvate transaminase [Tahibacter amnicola]|uniref:Valine--pyruvate transaminase n=1 Tax=Tahibacter amnicola TaxID=2976241 RepID=A0ABY6BHW1_9GAMM|nr:valine--pyruvate transaminase [Tahibacter amnicola]UXI69181.1 valine--pyruvate transaminase [Tahibacter amnicola]
MRYPLSALGQKMLRLTGVREIMRDIETATAAPSARPWINLSAGNPLVVPELERLWHGIARRLPSAEFGEVIGRYGSSRGYGPFLDTLAADLNVRYGWNISPRNLLVTPGSQTLFFILINLFAGAMSDGSRRRVLLPMSPEYTGYEGVTLDADTLASTRPAVETDGAHTFRYRIDPHDLVIGEDVGALLISRPGNPTGMVIPDAALEQLAGRAAQAQVPLIVDSAYGLPYPALNRVAMRPLFDSHVVHCMSFSKAGLPGARIGVAVADEAVIEAALSFLSNMNIHAPRLGQALVAQAIHDGSLDAVCRTVVGPLYAAKAQRLQALLREHLDGLPWRLHSTDGGLFGWLWLEDLPIDDLTLYARAKAAHVFVVPGSFFFVGLRGQWRHARECLRVSLTASDADLDEGVRRLAGVIRAAYDETPQAQVA